MLLASHAYVDDILDAMPSLLVDDAAIGADDPGQEAYAVVHVVQRDLVLVEQGRTSSLRSREEHWCDMQGQQTACPPTVWATSGRAFAHLDAVVPLQQAGDVGGAVVPRPRKRPRAFLGDDPS